MSTSSARDHDGSGSEATDDLDTGVLLQLVDCEVQDLGFGINLAKLMQLHSRGRACWGPRPHYVTDGHRTALRAA